MRSSFLTHVSRPEFRVDAAHSGTEGHGPGGTDTSSPLRTSPSVTPPSFSSSSLVQVYADHRPVRAVVRTGPSTSTHRGTHLR